MRKPRFFIILCAILFTFGLTERVSADATPKSKKTYKSHKAHKAIVHKKKALPKKKKIVKRDVKLNMPPPGHDGEERDDWFMRRRAWPNETIDPEAYPRALAQAAKMPVLDRMSSGGKHGTLATFTWQGIGPYSIDGRVSCIATHPTDSNTFYVGAAAGGLWKTTDHGSSWRCMTDTFGSLSIGCVTIDPVDPQVLYIGLGECNNSADSYPGNGLWKSVNGGATWTYLFFAKSQYIAKILIDPRDHNRLFVAIPGPSTTSDSGRGVFRSVDGGQTWIRSLTPRLTKSKTGQTVGCTDIAMNPLNSSQLIACMWDHSLPLASGFTSGSTGPGTGIWRSLDSGNSWARMDTVATYGLPNAYKIKIYGRSAALWTTDGSKTYAYVALTRRDTNKVTHYATDENFQGLYRSTDEGATWVKVMDSTKRIPLGGVQGKDSADIMNAQGGYNLYLAANPLRSNEVYLGGIDVLRSTDYGLSFTDITNSYSDYYVKSKRNQHSDQHGLAFTASGSGDDMLVVSDGGVFSTKDFGANWTQTPGLPITMFYGIEPWAAGMAETPNKISAGDLRVFGGTQDNGTVSHGLTADTAYEWINHGDGGIAASHPTDPAKIITSLQLGVIFARNSLDSLIATPLSIRDTTHDARPRWHNLSVHLLRSPGAPTDTSEPCSFIPPVVLDDAHPTELYTGRCHVYRAVVDWNDLENTRWQKWSPMIAGNLSSPSTWYYGDIETIATGVPDAAGHRMLWAGGLSSLSGAQVWRTVVDPARPNDTIPRWISINHGVPGANVSMIVPERSDSLTAFLTTSSTGNVAHVMRTTDGGSNWANISGNLPVTPVSALVIDTLAEQGDPSLKNKILIAATDVGVYVTLNGGAYWQQLGTGLPHVIISDLKIYKNMLIAASHGRSLYAMDISELKPGALGVDDRYVSLPTLSVYPNPVVNAREFSVQFASAQSLSSCRLIEESTGRELTAAISYKGGGEARIILPQEITSGSYIVELLSQSGPVARGRVSIQ
jgi:hypothetical protein